MGLSDIYKRSAAAVRRRLSPAEDVGCRSLTAVINGKVFSVGELHDRRFSSRLLGDGFAVRCGGFFGQRFLGERISVAAPCDGVIIKQEQEQFSLRTPDAAEITVYCGAAAHFLVQTGAKVTAGESVCRISVEALLCGRQKGSVIVLFDRPDQITELHISPGTRRTGDRAAFYKLT